MASSTPRLQPATAEKMLNTKAAKPGIDILVSSYINRLLRLRSSFPQYWRPGGKYFLPMTRENA